MTERSAQSHEAEAIDTVVKSSLTGVAATVLAVAILSPAGLGGMIGVSSAFGGSADTNVAPDSPYAALPPFATPLSAQELDAIHSQLAQSAASLEFTRAATNDRIERIRALAIDADALVTFEPTRVAEASPRDDLRLTLSEPVSTLAPVPAPIEPMPISYGGGSFEGVVPYHDPHLELAELFLAHAP